ncbi:MAG TPA: hypothetical protein VGJ80_00295 [Gemmatimonadales bacterium]|jgi:photosystem II stability/assembly factor-like uncharacterized protein
MRAPSLLVLCAATLTVTPLRAQSLDPRLLSGLEWRNVGPFRAGRISAASGVIGEPGVFYVGTPEGGVWKTTSAGATWYPIFDSIKGVSSIGAVEVAPSDPNVIYVGTGDLNSYFDGRGDGMYKSSDAGRTWRHIGLEATQQITSILIHPRDPNLVLVAALGGFFQTQSDARGVFRSTDGGANWVKTLYVDDKTGIGTLARAADAPDVIFAATMFRSVAPGTGILWGQRTDTAQTSTRLYKSVDAGITWREVSSGGLPRLTGRLSLAIAMGTNAQRMYLIGDFGLYRSDDGGTSWRRMAADDKRITNAQGGYNSGVSVDPKNPDVVYTFHVTAYKSTDGGNSFAAFKGGPPGGDDPQVMWIDPTDGKRILMGYDQGAIVSFDGGDTWSSWYNQSTEQVYHIATDNSFPYWIYATQQDAGAIATRSRGDLGTITPIDWKPVPGWEWGTILPDPTDPNIVFSSGLSISKISYPSGAWINVGPEQDRSLKLRASLNLPIVFSTWHGQRELLAGYQYLMATRDGGVTWTKLGPDLSETRAHPAPSDTSIPRCACIWSIAASTVRPDVIWIGVINGIVQVSRNHGVTWSDVTIRDIGVGLRVTPTWVEASPFDAGTAYTAFNMQYRGDFGPHIYRTSDYGKTWTKIMAGLPAMSPSGASVRVVRADPKRRGLLFAGTQSGVYVSFDDGDHWQSLMLNMPTTMINDIAIHDNDLIVGTYGRGIWVLDDYAVLRQVGPVVSTMPTRLLAPSGAVRVRRNVMYNTPLPKEEPQAPNPPDGAIIYYALGTTPASEVTIDVLDARRRVVRHMSSVPSRPVREMARAPMEGFWLAAPRGLPTNAGLNRTSWDLRYDPPPAFAHGFEFNGNPGVTPMAPEGPLVLPGTYYVRLTVDGQRYTQPLIVRPDPRSRVSRATLAAQDALLQRLYSGLQATWDDFRPVADLRAAVANLVGQDTTSELAKTAKALTAALDSIAGDSLETAREPWDPQPKVWSFTSLNDEFAIELEAQDNADHAPTRAALSAAQSSCEELRKLVERWRQLVRLDLATFNRTLQGHGMTALAPPAREKLCSP